ncbi:MAG: hypothetical protein M3020_02625 [Myxococcota bacterium]|nr:hypothetical protein [Myxococcota bacterium]
MIKKVHSKPKADIRRAVQCRIDEEPDESKKLRQELRRENQKPATETPAGGFSRETEYAFTKGISFINDGVAYGELTKECLQGVGIAAFEQSIRRTRSGRSLLSGTPKAHDGSKGGRS